MPKEIIDAEGNKTVVFTEEDIKALEAKKNEEIEAVRQEAAKLKEKDLNFANLREQKEAAERKAKAAAEEIDAKLENAKREIFEGVLKDHYESTIESLSGGDPEVRKKIEYHYKRLSDPAATKAEVEKKLRDAQVLAEPARERGVSGAFASGGAGPVRSAAGGTFTDEQKQFAKTLAKAGGIELTEEDLKKL